MTYKIGINGTDQTVVMTNVGGDVWQAQVPGQQAGELVRYRIDADVAVAPFAGDTINYFGVVVSPTDIVDNTLPVFQFFVDPDQFEELTTTDLALTNTRIPVVVAYGDQVFDNATVRVRGGDFSRANYPKKSLKFELPDGYAMDVGAEGSYLIDEFGIQADFGDWSVAAPDISWDVFNAETESFTSSFFTRVEQNGDFWGVFRFQELYDGAWRTANGYDDSEFFKTDAGGFGSTAKFDKKNPKDDVFTSINVINEVVTAPPSESKTAWLYENVDIPNVINHMALSTIMRHDDQRVQNFYMAQDPDTKLWSMVEWDLDRTWRDTANQQTPFTTPESIRHELMDSLWEVSEFRDLYWRRMQTLVDTYLSDDTLVDARATVISDIGATNSALEFAKWGRTDIFTSDYFVEDWVDAIQDRRDAFANESRMPGTESGNYNIVINELHYNPADDDAEFLELFNNSNESVDLSGWQIDGVGITIDFGTVILPNEYIVFTDNYETFRGQYAGNIYVGAQYSGGLKGGGELVTLFDDNGSIQDQVDYSDTAPWPEGPDGTGFTLSLINPNLDNSLASSWQTSAVINGTPASANGSTPIGSTITVRALGDEATELFALQINGLTVETFAVTDSFVEYSYQSNTVISPQQVRIVFLNDEYDPQNGIDANLKVDWFEIDSFRIQAESDLVYSTGTWNSADGIVPGFGRGDTLHTEGFFEYRVG